MGDHSWGRPGAKCVGRTCFYLLGFAVHWVSLSAVRKCKGSPVEGLGGQCSTLNTINRKADL